MKRATKKRTVASKRPRRGVTQAKVHSPGPRHSSLVTRHSLEQAHEITVTINGVKITRRVPARQHLIDFLREDLDLTGSHVGCEHGVCGACTVRVDGIIVRGCLTLAVQADGRRVDTIEGLSDSGELAPLQEAFHRRNAAQCGYCTPGMLVAALDLVANHPKATREQIREHLSGNYCRCTGYQAIVDAIEDVLRK
jgi:aerobic-type carbon monoxide dehydrogenase small subunit (CoxS/CutS family)